MAMMALIDVVTCYLDVSQTEFLKIVNCHCLTILRPLEKFPSEQHGRPIVPRLQIMFLP